MYPVVTAQWYDPPALQVIMIFSNVLKIAVSVSYIFII